MQYAMQGAQNNAQWCEIVCRTHGIETQLQPQLWSARRRSPPAYPDAVTLSHDVPADEVLRLVDFSSGCSVKDSFASLDLSPAGFGVLFEAQWIQRPPRADPAVGDWRAVRTAEELRAWGAAHGLGDVLRPALLAHPDVTVLGAHHGDAIVGGAIANRGGGVVGLSNVFSTAGADADWTWAGAVAAVGRRHPGLPIVGYEYGDDLDAARAIGFTTNGPLRVWLRT